MDARPTCITDPLFLDHDPGRGHPESPERLRAIERLLAEKGWADRLAALPARDARDVELRGVHSAEMVAAVHAAAGRRVRFDADTVTSPASSAAAVRAAGAVVAAAEAAAQGRRRVLVLPRPPGHHAERDRIMGFCMLNNVAVAAHHAATALGFARVAVVDWDVHHGNGTQDIFYGRRDVLYVSTHQYPWYPGTGHPREVGAGPGEGYTVNVPMPAGAGDAELMAAFDRVIEPVLRAYEPQLILVSAGFDAHRADPLASLAWTEDGYARACARLCAIADTCADGRLVLALEGGYDLDALAASIDACLHVMSAPEPRPPNDEPRPVDPGFIDLLGVVRSHLDPWWSVLR
jgi:acetoin utilization deacetylase AcuC-like enzyme